jgi:diguanylate cyclase (GGDEF)-like protein/PAS domain S-box-containing protein
LKTQEIARVGTWRMNLATKLVTWSAELYKMYGLDPAISLPTYIEHSKMHTPDSWDLLSKAIERTSTTGSPYELELEIIKGDGSHGWVWARGEAIKDSADNIVSLWGAAQDITERKRIELSLLKSEEKYKSLVMSMDQGLALHEIILDANGMPEDYIFLDINESYTKLVGLTREMCIGKRVKEIMPQVEQYWIDVFGKVAITGEPAYYENLFATNGRHYATYSYSPKKFQFAVLVSDIEDRIQREERINYLSYHDPLTGLYNRRFYEEELKRLDTERNMPLTIAMGDINGLKLVNDALGHQAGDELIKNVAEAIRLCCRTDDIIARVGGDEFVIILTNTDALEAEKLLARIGSIALGHQVKGIVTSISFGYETKTSKEQSMDELFKSAEDQMYRHKLSESASIKSNMISLIMNTLNEKNPYDQFHAERVSRICEFITKCLNFQHDDIHETKLAGLMHDIGKIGIDEKVLNNEGKLNIEERDEIKRHSEVGYRILSSCNEFSEIANYILAHHERWDGKGYPQRLKGEEIPIQGRIIAIADAFDAMISERPYKKALSIDEALAEIDRCAGTLFDPEIAKVFVMRFKERK